MILLGSAMKKLNNADLFGINSNPNIDNLDDYMKFQISKNVNK